MAFIVPGPLVTSINGKVGDVVFYRGRWGQVAREWVYPTNTITPERTAVRNNFSTILSIYNSLTPDLQNDWNIYASTLVKRNRSGQPYVPTGLQIFMERSINISMVGGIINIAPSPNTPFGDLQNFYCNLLDPANMVLQTPFIQDPGHVPPNTRLLLYASTNQVAHKMRQKNRLRIIRHINAGDISSTDIILPYLSVWSPIIPITGMRIFFKAVAINTSTGQAGAPFYCSQLVS